MKKHILFSMALFALIVNVRATPQLDIAMNNHEPPASPALPGATQALESLITYAHEAILEADSVRIVSCFAPCISVTSEAQTFELTRKEFIELAISKYGSFATFSSHLQFLLSGFVLSHEEGAPVFINEHSSDRSSLGVLEVTGNYVNFRKAPALNSSIICKLPKGMYNGKFNTGVWDIEDSNGIVWKSIIIDHPDFGVVKGFISNSFIREISPVRTPRIEVRKTDNKYRITRFEFTES